jgi:hypothetical protein
MNGKGSGRRPETTRGGYVQGWDAVFGGSRVTWVRLGKFLGMKHADNFHIKHQLRTKGYAEVLRVS